MTVPFDSYQIIGDNVDLKSKPTHFSLSTSVKDHHWFSLYAIKNRVHGEQLANDKPTADISTLPLTTWLPSVNDCVLLHDEFIILVSCVLVAKLMLAQHLTNPKTGRFSSGSRKRCSLSQQYPLPIFIDASRCTYQLMGS